MKQPLQPARSEYEKRKEILSTVLLLFFFFFFFFFLPVKASPSSSQAANCSCYGCFLTNKTRTNNFLSKTPDRTWSCKQALLSNTGY